MGLRRPADIALGTLGATTLTIALAAGGTLGETLLHTGGAPSPGLTPDTQAIVLPKDRPAPRDGAERGARRPAARSAHGAARPSRPAHRAGHAHHPAPHRTTRAGRDAAAHRRADHATARALARPVAAAKLPPRAQGPAGAAATPTPAAAASMGFARLRVDDLKVQPTGNGTSRLHLRLTVEGVPATTTTTATGADLPRTVDVHLRVPSPPAGKAMQVGVALVPPAPGDPGASPGLHVSVAVVDATTPTPAVTDVPPTGPDASNTLQIVTPVGTRLDGAPDAAPAPATQPATQPAAPLADAVLPLDAPPTAVQTVSLDAPAPPAQP